MNNGNQLELTGNRNEENRPPVDSLVISVRQPWAWLIINGGKDIENRDWFTKVRGRVLMHAAKGVTKTEWQGAWGWVHQIAPDVWEKGCKEILPGTIERGGIVGSVEIVDCVTRSDSQWFQGRYGFVLRDPQPLPFYPCRGQLGFFRI
jgi:ASCH domain